jgi:hypothetical protein
MASRIKHKRSSVAGRVPVIADLDAGELALNTSDGKVYLKKDNDEILDITSTIFKNDTNVTVTDTGSDGTITMQADGATRMAVTADQVQLKEDVLLENAKEFIFGELDANGINYVSLKAPDSLASSYTMNWPEIAGTIGQVLSTNGSGQLRFIDSDTFGGNRIYVSQTKGDDANDGQTAPVKTVKRALQIASGLVYTSGGIPNGTEVAVMVSAGDYVEDNPIIIPDNVSVLGNGLRTCIMRPLNANKDMLRVRNGCYFNEFTFRDGLSGGVPTITWDYAVAFDDPLDPGCDRSGYTFLPTTKPTITTSPFTQNVSIISFLGGNGHLVDGSKVQTPNAPLNPIEAENPVSGPVPEQGKSMVSNAFTMVSFGGTGWRVINEAYAQIVSCFQIFMLNGVYTQSGGYVSITNSATNFGLYALRASGYGPNAFEFDKGYIGATGTTGSTQTITAFGMTRANGPVEEFVIRIYDPTTNADLTSDYKTGLPNFIETSFNAATDVSVSTNVFTIASHGFNNGDAVTYSAAGGTTVGGLFNGDIYYVRFLTTGEFILCFDNSLTREVNITSVGSGTQKFTKQDYEMFVFDITETHNSFQNITLAAGSGDGYTFVAGDAIEGITGGLPNRAFVFAYDATNRILTVCINKVTVGVSEVRNFFDVGSSITKVGSTTVSYAVTAVSSRTDLYAADFQIQPTIIGGAFTDTGTLPGKKIWFHRPSITNSSAHTWEYAGSGTDYNALPQNGGKTVEEFEQVNENAGRVYTSGTNELGDFKVGAFVRAFNRTGNVTFTNKVTVDTLDVLKLGVGGVTVETISTDADLGENEVGGPKDTRISTQLAVYSYAQNRLGNVLDKNVSTNAVPGSLVQLNSNGQINADLIPTSRSFTNFSSAGYNSRLAQVNNVPANDMLSGDIATENFTQEELTLSSQVTVPTGTPILQTTGNTATTGITSSANQFIVTHSGAVTVPKDSYVLIEGATPSEYNGMWLVNNATAGTFTVFSNINPGTATVQGTIYYGGASGIVKGDYTSSSNLLIGSVYEDFNTPFTASANTLIIGTDRTPSDSNTAVNPTLTTNPSETTGNYFLRTATSGQYLIIDPSSNPTYTDGKLSKAFRYNNIAYVTTSAAHNFSSGNAVRVRSNVASFNETKYVTVTSATELYYDNIAANSATSANTSATATLNGATGATTMTGSVPTASLTGTITVGDFVFDTAGTIPKGSKITAVNMAVNPRTFTITFPQSSTVASTTTATLDFFTPATVTGSIRSVITAADSLSQGEFLEYRNGILTTVNNLTGLTGGTGYTNGIYTRVPLTNVTGSGVGALADITVSAGGVSDVDLVFGGADYVAGSTLSANNFFLGGTGAGFQITTSAVEKRAYLNLIGGQTFVATPGAPDFVEHNSSVVASLTATSTVVATFDARSTGAGGGVDTVLNRITTFAAHGFTDGDPVQYNPGTDPALGGLITNNVYYVKVINSTTFELYNNYNLDSIQILSTSTGAAHTVTRRAVDLVKNTFTVPGHGFVTGDAFRILGADLPSESGVQIGQNTFWFVGSVTTNSFTVHNLRADALSSIAGIVLGSGDLTATGSGTITVVKATIKVIGTVNTSSTVETNWNSLVTTNIDASNIISGTINTSRLGGGTANSSTFLRGDSTWATAVKSVQVASGSVLSAIGSGSSPFYGDVTIDVNKANSTGGSGGYSTIGVAGFNTTQFAVGTGDSLNPGEVFIKAGVVDAGTLDTYDSSYFLNPSNLTSAVPVNKGGTALSTYATGDMIFATGATTLNKLNIDVADNVLTSTGTAPQWSSGLTIPRRLSTSSAEISTASTSAATVFNENAKAIDIGGAATSVAIGSSSATESLTSSVKSYTTSGSASLSVTAQIGLAATISTIARNGSNVATIVTTVNHGLTNGDLVTVVCSTDGSFNTVNSTVTVVTATTFTYSNTGATVSTVASSGTVYIGSIGAALSSNAGNGTTELAFASTSGIQAGMLVQGTNISAGTTVAGVNGTRVYLSAATSGAISSTTIIAFTNTNKSLGLKPGDQITIDGSGVTALNGTWPVTSAGSIGVTFTFKIFTNTTQSNLARVGTIVKESTFLIRNRNVTIGSSEASSTPVSAVIKAENGVGSEIAGASLLLQGGLATGLATNGSIRFITGTPNGIADRQARTINRMEILGSVDSNALDLVTSLPIANVFNTTATTVNFAGAASVLTLANTGTSARAVNIATAATAGTSTLTFGGAVTGNIFKINSVAGGTVNLTSDVTTGVINLYTGTTTGTINIGSASSLVEVGTLEFNNQLRISSTEAIGISTVATAVSTFPIATYRSAKFTVQVTCTAGTDVGKYQISEILMLQDGTTATLTDYAVIRSGNNLVTFTADVSAPEARLLATATAGNTIKVRVVRYLNTI